MDRKKRQTPSLLSINKGDGRRTRRGSHQSRNQRIVMDSLAYVGTSAQQQHRSRNSKKDERQVEEPQTRRRRSTRTATRKEEEDVLNEDREWTEQPEKVDDAAIMESDDDNNDEKRSRQRKRIHVPESDDEDFEEDDEEEDEEEDGEAEEKPCAAASQRTRTRRTRAPRKSKDLKGFIVDDDEGNNGSDEEDSKDEEEEEEHVMQRRRTLRRSSAIKATQKLKAVGKQERKPDDEDDEPPSSTRRAMKGKSKYRPSLHDSSDDEFQLKEDEEPASGDEDGQESEVVQTPFSSSRKSHPKAVNIDGDDIGSADASSSSNGSSSDSEEDEHVSLPPRTVAVATRTYSTPSSTHKQKKKMAQSTLDEIRPSPAKKRRQDGGHDDSSFSSGNEDEEQGKNLIRRKVCCKTSHRPRLPDCPSTEDAITNEPLPKIHVCYVSPDGQSRQCFALETLRQIAIQSSHMPFRVDVLDGSQRDTFLQPPHFRTPMNDDLLDQIASRFGRSALDLHGEFYNRKSIGFFAPGNHRHGRHDLDDEDGDEDRDYDYEDIFGQGRVEFGDDFVERIQNYMSSQMGSGDIYACPLCYSEMHRRIFKLDQQPNRTLRDRYTARNTRTETLDDDDDDEMVEEFLSYPGDSEYDPMTVLLWDKKSSPFYCYRKIVDIKEHLRESHEVSTQGIKGSELYQRYRVRGQDGLLQRFLHKYWQKTNAPTFQGAMKSYWHQGHNQDFLYLREQMEENQAVVARFDNLGEDDDEDEHRVRVENLLQPAKDFYKSFQNRAKEEWERISSPFRPQKDDLKDFLAADDDVEEEADGPPTPYFLAHRQFQQEQENDSDPNDLVHKLERKYANDHEEGGSEADEISGSEDEDEVLIEVDGSKEDDDDQVLETRNGYYSEVEEERDEWVKELQDRRKRQRSKLSPNDSTRSESTPPKTPTTSHRKKKLVRRKNAIPTSTTTRPATATPTDAASTPTPKSKRLVIAEDSSSSDTEAEFR